LEIQLIIKILVAYSLGFLGNQADEDDSFDLDEEEAKKRKKNRKKREKKKRR